MKAMIHKKVWNTPTPPSTLFLNFILSPTVHSSYLSSPLYLNLCFPLTCLQLQDTVYFSLAHLFPCSCGSLRFQLYFISVFFLLFLSSLSLSPPLQVNKKLLERFKAWNRKWRELPCQPVLASECKWSGEMGLRSGAAGTRASYCSVQLNERTHT